MPLRLKSLELHGYKTFANRTFFEFSDAVTAIVGPNGSGKSNIADSLRWVLGEQSYSLLRARKTEDMIFAGSESRSRAGMASATITFDNSDAWLPIDFSEVAITRRAHRDGLNEYLINGQRVRLKDVSEMLAESGLAERTYTVIGQGLVDAALSLRADERRRLFEEAAGIGLHRSRREEALRRLEATERNLERVEDILAELQPRLSSLERQARRAQEYEQVRSDLQVLLHEWYGFHWNEAQKLLAEAQKAAQAQEARLEEARRVQENIEERFSGLREQIQSQRDNLNNWHRQLSELHARREEAIRRLAKVEERERSLLIQQEGDMRDLSGMDEEHEFHQEQIQAAEQEVARLKADAEEARQQAESASRMLVERQAERSEAEKAVQARRDELGELNAYQGILQARQAESQAQGMRASVELETAQAALEDAQQALKTAESRRQSAEMLVESAEENLRSAEDALESHRLSLQEADESIARAREHCRALSADVARLEAELAVFEQAEASLTGYASGTRLILQAARENRLHGARGALNAYMEVPANLERAISAALGDFLDAVLLEVEPDQALDILEKESGRGVLLPLRDLKPAFVSVESLEKSADILGEAADLVEVAADFRPAVALLLSGVIVVKDRSAARRALVNQPPGARAVTLRGEVFYASGPILSGTAGPGSAETTETHTLLGRGRQRRESQASIQRIAKQIEKADAELQTLTDKRAALQAEGSRLEQMREAARNEVLKTNRLFDQARAEVDQATRQLIWSKEQSTRLEQEKASRLSEAEQIKVELNQLDSKLVTARKSLRESNVVLESLALDEFQTRQSHWITRLAVGERALSDVYSRLAERRQALERTMRAREALQERLSGLDLELNELEGNRQEARLSEGEVGNRIRELTEKLGPAEAELVELEHRQGADQKEASAVYQQVSIAEHLNAQTRINLARNQEALQSLQRRIEDDFGLVDFEYTAQVSGPTPLPLLGMVDSLPIVHQLSPDIEENIKRQRAQLRRMGPVNPEAQAEYQEVRQRFEFLNEQVADLEKAQEDIRQAISELDEMMRREFFQTFEAVAGEFRQIFTRLFGGGTARLVLTEPDDLTATGIEIEARLPGRREQGLALLSGGERSLTAASLVFALLRVSPTPFCVLDEVDAMLDEANVGRFRELLSELSQQTQFVIVTHNRNTVEAAGVIYGVTMGVDSSSQVLSLKLDEVEKVIE
jgi:chromosome segregation protein